VVSEDAVKSGGLTYGGALAASSISSVRSTTRRVGKAEDEDSLTLESSAEDILN
jgi:hypothetical protein